MAMKIATYATLPTAAATNAGPALSGVPATTAARRARRGDRDERDDRAAQPAAEHDLPRRRRRQPREVERPGAHLGAEHRVADDERGDRHHEPEDALGRDVGERPLGGVVDGVGEQPEQQRAGARQQDRGPPLRRDARLQRVDEDRDEPRPRPRRCVAGAGAVIGRAPGTGSRASRRARAPRAGGPTCRARAAGSAIASSRACTVWITSPSRVASNVTPATDSSATSDGRQPPPVVGAHQHVPRAVVHRVADRVVPAGGGQPAVHEHDHPLGQPLDLVEHVRADDHGPALRAESLEQRDEVHALHRIGAVQRLVEHEHVRDRSRARRRSSCAGASPC